MKGKTTMKKNKKQYAFGNSNYRKMNSNTNIVNSLILAAYKNFEQSKKSEFFTVLSLLGASTNNKKYTVEEQAKSIANYIQNFKFVYGSNGFTPCNTNEIKEIVYGVELTDENRTKYPILDKYHPSNVFSAKCSAGYMIINDKVHTWCSNTGLNDEYGLDYLAFATASLETLKSFVTVI